MVVFATGEGQVNVDASIYDGYFDDASTNGSSAHLRSHQSGPFFSGAPLINEHVFEIFYLKFDHVDLENIGSNGTNTLPTYASSTLSTPVNSLGFESDFPSAIPGSIPASFSYPNPPGSNPGPYSVPICGIDYVRAMVHGYFEIPGDPSGRAATTVAIPGAPSNSAGSYVLPAGRWVLPEDWPVLATFAGFTAGGAPNEAGFGPTNAPASVFAWDLASGWSQNPGSEQASVCVGPSAGSTTTTGSITDANLGPCYSTDAAGTNYETAPNANCAGGETVGIGPWDPTQACTTPFPLTFTPTQGDFAVGGSSGGIFPFGPNSTYLPNGTLNEWDAPMPPALVSFGVTSGPGKLDQVDKSALYSIPLLGADGKPNGNSIFPDPFYAEAIPASPIIPPLINDGGYAVGHLWLLLRWRILGTGHDHQRRRRRRRRGGQLPSELLLRADLAGWQHHRQRWWTGLDLHQHARWPDLLHRHAVERRRRHDRRWQLPGQLER